jgi:hypothetical protein
MLVFKVLVVHVLSQQKSVFNFTSVHVDFVVHKVATGLVFLGVLRFFPVIIILPFLHAHLHLRVALISRTNGRRLGTFQKSSALSQITEYHIKE